MIITSIKLTNIQMQVTKIEGKSFLYFSLITLSALWSKNILLYLKKSL